MFCLPLPLSDIVQRQLGMVNNRVFEALSCGAVLLSDCFPALIDAVGDHVLCIQRPGDITRHLQYVVVVLISSDDDNDE